MTVCSELVSMTFTSDERREVAQKLREKKKEFFGERS